ncbi:helix-turn-helix domain-containing protein [Halomonas garicola]|uniref:helix-turn-helix domain-containing protein n=1 Tax=Halomonas garicola TaxID=1690008 RepID=UPI0028964B50|nr:helix-turn-helix domain-containing protein [Halomonas garicola]
MSFATEHLAERLKAAREAKGLSQRALSKLSGVPQSHISKIESHAVDLRISSLVTLAHALELELMLVPRQALPAVRSVTRSVTPKPLPSRAEQRELARIQNKINDLVANAPSAHLAALQRRVREITQIHSQLDVDVLQKVRRAVEAVEPSSSDATIRQAEDAIHSLRNRLAHSAAAYKKPSAPRPAYQLEEDSDD